MTHRRWPVSASRRPVGSADCGCSDPIERTYGLSVEGESEEGVDRGFERTDVALDLGE
jgi:hypothetical protein